LKDAPLEIWKFGGASVRDAAAIRRAAALVAAHRGPLLVVVSALAGVTDLLLDGARRAAAGESRAPEATAAAFARRHLDVARRLGNGRERRRLEEQLRATAREYEELARALLSLKTLPERVSDLLVSRGERAAAALLLVALRAGRRRVALVDATLCVSTDGRHGGATPDLATTRARARALLRPPLRGGGIVIVPGFLGRAPDGSLTTLGRGGSDLTATLLARATGAARIVLWKDVPGVLTADPRLVPDARLIPQLHQGEAAEAAYYGAKVLHPRALIPLEGSRIPLVVRSFLDPARPGTEISTRRTLPGYPVKALATIPGQALVTVAGRGLLGVPGVAARAFGAVHDAGLSVSTIFQASSESSIGFTLPETDVPAALAALRRAFREELGAGLVSAIEAEPGMAVIAVVGNGMAGTPGIAARVFGALAEGGVNVVAIAQGSSERNITFVVRASEAGLATRRVHQAFQLSKIGGGQARAARHSDVVLLGFGRVGRSLVEQLAAAGRELRVVGVLDRSGFVFEPDGLSRRKLQELSRRKHAGAALAELGGTRAGAETALAFAAEHAVSRPILVDVTAEETGALLLAALGHGFDLVLANKRPLAGALRAHERLLEAVAARGRRLRFEATVGAGLPILDTWRKLVDTGDAVRRIDGCVSGTLGFVLSALDRDVPFSEAVAEAVRQGYAEPDPREDLCGLDAARKALILGRLLGYRGPAPLPESLVPRALRRVSPGEFARRLPEFDAAIAARARRERGRGRVLRYVVSAAARGVRAGLQAVAAGSPIGALAGTRNLVSFTTRRYSREPLVITGPGAGAEVTAAGLLADIQDLARSRID